MQEQNYRDQTRPIEADKRGRIIPQMSVRLLLLDLTAARNEVQFKLEGDFLFADPDSTGRVYVRLNNSAADQWPIVAQGGIQDIPINDVFITHAAQVGSVMRLWYGYRARFLTPAQAISTIGTITNPVNVRDYGTAYGAKFTSTAFLAAAATENVWAAAANTAGAILALSLLSRGGGAYSPLYCAHAHTAAPAAITDGDIVCASIDSHTAASIGDQIQPLLIPTGKGLWWRNGGPAVDTSALRAHLYTLL